MNKKYPITSQFIESIFSDIKNNSSPLPIETLAIKDLIKESPMFAHLKWITNCYTKQNSEEILSTIIFYLIKNIKPHDGGEIFVVHLFENFIANFIKEIKKSIQLDNISSEELIAF